MSNHRLIELLDPKVSGLGPEVPRTNLNVKFSPSVPLIRSRQHCDCLKSTLAHLFQLARGLFPMSNHQLIVLLVPKVSGLGLECQDQDLKVKFSPSMPLIKERRQH
jgi:hypothetical protein